MQHHPGSWYLPWGVPIQKMMALPLQHPGASAMLPYAQAVSSNGGGVAATCQMISNQHSPNTVAAMQAQTAPHNYQHPALHATAGTHVPIGAYNCSTSGAALHHANAAIQHSSVLNGHTHGHSHIQNSQLQNLHGQSLQSLHAAAAAMFTPLSLRAFLTSGSNSMAGLTTQQTLTPCGPSAHQQNLSTATTVTAPPQRQQLPTAMNVGGGVPVPHHTAPNSFNSSNALSMPIKKLSLVTSCDKLRSPNPEKRKAEDYEQFKDLKKAKLETKALKAKRPGFTDERYYETSYFIENGLRKVYPYYFTFTTFTKGRWVGEKILSVFAREFRAHPAEEYERCIKAGTLTVNYEKVPIDYKLKHNDLLANIVHRHEVPVTSQPITIVHMDDDIVVVNKPASIPVHPCGRYRHNTVVFILAKEYSLKNLRTIHRLDRLTSGLLLFGRSPKKARQMEHQIRNRQVQKEYICRVEGDFPEGIIECKEPIEVVSYKIGVCKVSSKGKDCTTTFQKIVNNGKTSVVLCKPLTGRMHQIRVHLQYLGFPVVNDPLYNHEVFGPLKGRGGDVGGKTDEELVRDLINIHNAENWLGIDGDSDISLFKTIKGDCDADSLSLRCCPKGNISDDDSETASREASPYSESPQPALVTMTVLDGNESPCENTSTSLPTENMSLHETTHVANSELAGSNNTNAIPYEKVTVATQTGQESPDMAYNAEKMTSDKHCYECKVRYRDPKPKDLVMYLHAWKYKGPGWEYETELPNWASTGWIEPKYD